MSKEKTRYIMGKNAILELMRREPDRIVELYYSSQTLEGELAQVRRKRKLNKRALYEMTHSENHQGVVAKIKENKEWDLHSFLDQAGKHTLLVMLDSIEDPQNFGSILRSCECFGVDAVIYSKNRGAPLSATAAKTSVGASELIPRIVVSNLAQAADVLVDYGYLIYAAEHEKDALSFRELPTKGPRVLIMGSEGKGVRALLKKKAHKTVSIPLKGQINSLNVSQATAILLSQMVE